MQRVVVIGTCGSGKTTLGRRVADLLQCPRGEMDAWSHLAGWQDAPPEQFHTQVSNFCAAERWVLDGNYPHVRDLAWLRADTLVWLDYPAPLVFWRLLQRTGRRAWTREELWNGNREQLWKSLFARDGLLSWFFQTHGRYHRETPFMAAEYPHLQLVRLHTPRKAEGWLRDLVRSRR